jgi:SAM-dependent methyltransferase
MVWLAMRGRLHHEYIAHGILPSANSTLGTEFEAKRFRLPGRYILGGFRAFSMRAVLVVASAAGALAGVIDLQDLAEAGHQLHFPVLQLGVPILAFVGALVTALSALTAAKQDRAALAWSAAQNRNSFDGVVAAPELLLSGSHFSERERSLRAASFALFSIGMTSLVLAELAEAAYPEPAFAWIWGLAIAATLCALTAVVLPLFVEVRRAEAALALEIEESIATRGLVVDRRADYVDVLESVLTFGRRKEILAATLQAAGLRPGEKFLDVGCGTGDLTLHAASIVGREAVGIDATGAMIAIARRKARETTSPARYFAGVAEALPFGDEAMSVVSSTFLFHHLPSDLKRDALLEMWRVLAPGGRLVITDYGWARSGLGLIASLPMRLNFHEHVRGQLNGELEQIIASEGLGQVEVARSFLGYIRVLRLVKRETSRIAGS